MDQPTVAPDLHSPDPAARRAAYDQERAAAGEPPLTDAEWTGIRERAHRDAARIVAGPPPGAWDGLAGRLAAARTAA